MSDYIPLEVVADIFSRLPVKSLVQFRSVSKPLCALIDSSDFINLHQNRSMETTITLIFLKVSNSSRFIRSINISLGSTFVKLETPFDSTIGYYPDVVSFCNGLMCLSREGLDRETLLWNPSTKKYKLIRAPAHIRPSYCVKKCTIDQIGYDHVNNDYKVVKLSQFHGSGHRLIDTQVIVYSLKLNEWQSVDLDFPYHVCPSPRNGPGVCVGGAVHWCVSRRFLSMNRSIAAFDLATQTLQLVPEADYSDIYVKKDLGVLGGSLCVIGNRELYGVDIWVMREYGVKESWSKLIALTKSDVKNEFMPSVKVVIIFNNGKEVLLDMGDEWHVCYHLEKKKARHVKVRGGPYASIFAFHESLVQIH